ncbi:NAD(P)H-binding protein [Nocardia xishanensis]
MSTISRAEHSMLDASLTPDPVRWESCDRTVISAAYLQVGTYSTQVFGSTLPAMLTVVFGASGNVGRHVVAGLNSIGAQVRLTTRNPETATLPPGADVVAADLEHPETLASALEGAHKVFLYARSEGIDGFVKAAEAAGVQHVVLLSSVAVLDLDPTTNPTARLHTRVESALEASDLAWTFIRPGMFAANSLWSWQQPIRNAGAVRLPYPDARTAPVHEKDVAALAVAALTETTHHGRAYVVSGPEALTLRRQVQHIAEALGRDIAIEESSVDQARAELVEFVPPFVADAILDGWKAAAETPPPVSTAVADILGCPARTFAQWAIDHEADFR